MSRRQSIAGRIISEGIGLLIAARKSAAQEKRERERQAQYAAQVREEREVKARKEQKALQAGIQQIDYMSGTEFEEYLAGLFKRLGYIVETTQASHDYGADLIICKDGNRTVVQIKRYGSSVSLGAVQEAVAAKSHYKCNLAMVVTNRHFTKPARKLAKSNNVVLWDRSVLVEKILKIKQSANQSIHHGYLIEQETGQAHPLLTDQIDIGRDASNDVVVGSTKISRQHANILFEAGQPILIDLDSMNGTSVNGVRIKRCALNVGDKIMFDQNLFVYSKKPFIS